MSDHDTDWPELDPIEFELAHGAWVKVAAANFFEILTESDRQLGHQPRRFFAIRIYSNNDNLNNRMEFAFEFRANKDFEIEGITKAWDWLSDLIGSRAHIEFEGLDEFIEEFGEQLSLVCTESEDTVVHITHLPELHVPEAFDRVDDSFFNDQNEPAGADEPRHTF